MPRPSVVVALLAVVGTMSLAGVACAPGAGAPAVPVSTDRGEAAADTTVRITASGDIGSSDQASAVLEGVAHLDPDLHLALGDLSYGRAGEERAWCDFVTQRVGPDLPFELVSGNHESDGLNGNIDDFAACLPNRLPGLVGEYGRQWYADVPAVNPLLRIVAISPGLTFPTGDASYAAGSPRWRWTEEAIDGARAASIPWVVVAMHAPCLSTGVYDCVATTDVLDLLIRTRVDLVLSGHEHLYQRTKQLATAVGCPAVAPGTYDTDCVADDGDRLVAGAGTVFVTAGTGGTGLRDSYADDAEAPYFAAVSGANAEPTWGSLELTVSRDSLAARFAPAAGAGFDDSFVLHRPE